jgi:beta-galactosidase
MQPARDLSHFTSMRYGGDYNPEQWGPEVWREDVALMQGAGVNMVSLGIFSWAQLEPREGEFTFGWLDEVMDLLGDGGIAVNLATATASPPPWMAAKYPESLPITRTGIRLSPGARQQYCPHSVAYRGLAARLVTTMAERYKSHNALAMWHINNEYGCHVAESFTPAGDVAFRRWLLTRYGTIDALNAAWGTAFWSQRYDSFAEVSAPRAMPTFGNPTMMLDWNRFSSSAIEDLFRMEGDILRRITPNVPINTNFMGFFKPLDYWSHAAHQDVVSDDNYQDPMDPDAHILSAARGDLMRSLRHGQPWLLMEQTSSAVNWRPRNAMKRPNQMRLWSMQSVAHGADGIMFFQWRAAKAGAEKFHGAMVPHAGADTRVYREISALGHDLAKLDAVVGSRINSDVAIVFDWESWWAVDQPSHTSADVNGMAFMAWYRTMFVANSSVDFVSGRATLEQLRQYKLVLVPNLYLMRQEFADALNDYVHAGGHVVVGPYTAITNVDDHIYLGGYPGPLRDMLGITIEDFEALRDPNSVMVDGARFSCSAWRDVIHLQGASAVGSFGEGWFAGGPVVTRNEFGAGSATYVGTVLGDDGLAWVLGQAARDAGVAAAIDVPDGVEVVVRESDGDQFVFLLNHNESGVTVTLDGEHRDVLTDTVGASHHLDGFGVAVVSLLR